MDNNEYIPKIMDIKSKLPKDKVINIDDVNTRILHDYYITTIFYKISGNEETIRKRNVEYDDLCKSIERSDKDLHDIVSNIRSNCKPSIINQLDYLWVKYYEYYYRSYELDQHTNILNNECNDINFSLGLKKYNGPYESMDTVKELHGHLWDVKMHMDYAESIYREVLGCIMKDIVKVSTKIMKHVRTITKSKINELYNDIYEKNNIKYTQYDLPSMFNE